ncbi:LOW QUALITY PROTEIN: Retrovirus-related Gag-pol Polyprotein [Phytophthora megakarya]|uniref:Retrovirus-related Gag-pol Polyprotein n=1 Tax=Phytophthora megakarya TaxID=4795 RepID=A0A225WFP5_9STRA|nr:LOW QUALITY PROTEIN: Retrovirus-related Gag-pol Polyprotein [Phytophthora megakarya]
MYCWDVVDGTCGLDLSDHGQEAIFRVKDNIAREAILSGVPEEDAEMICQEETAQAMWNRFVDKQTKREYSNYIFARTEFYSNGYTPDKSMDQWLREMEKFRRELLHYGMQVSDADFAETLLGHVSRTHRDVVRQFSKHYVVRQDGGADRPVPMATQVMNALRAELVLDEKDEHSISVCSACNKKNQNQGKGKQQQKKSKYKAKIHNQKVDNPQGSQRKVTRKCYKCGKIGHIRPNCPELQDAAAAEKPAESEFKRWEKKKVTFERDEDDQPTRLVERRKNSSAICCNVRGNPVAKKRVSSSSELEWVLDSASDVHVCNQQDILNNLRVDVTHSFESYDGAVKENELVGDVHLRVRNNKQPHADITLPFTSVLLMTGAPENVLSQDLLEGNGWNVKFGWINSQRVCWIRKDDIELLLKKERRRYRLKATAVEAYSVASLGRKAQEQRRSDSKALTKWHLRFAHLNYAMLRQMARKGVATGMESELPAVSEGDEPCWNCKMATMTRMSYKRTVTRRATRPMQKILSDMCYVGVETYDRYAHFQLVQDEASRYLWGFFLRRKEEATQVVLTHLKWIIAQGHKIEVFNSDQGRELLNNTMKTFLQGHGIEYTWTNAYSPEENGLVEKINGVVMARVRTLLSTANMPNKLWSEAFKFTIEVNNVSATSALDGDTPYCRRYGERPDVSSLRTWGCVVMIFTPKVLGQNKLENPGKPGLFMGFAKHSDSYRVHNLLNGHIDEVRSMEFEEDWTVEQSYVNRLLINRYGKGRSSLLPTVIPYIRLPVVHQREASVSQGLSDCGADRSAKRLCTGGDRTVCVVPDTVGGALGGAAAPTQVVPAGPAQSGGNALRLRSVVRDGGERDSADLPNSSRVDFTDATPARPAVPSVGATDGEDIPVNDDTEFADVNFDGHDDAVAMEGDDQWRCDCHQDPDDALDRLVEYDDGNADDEDDDVENDGWSGSPATASFRRSTRVRRPNVRLQDYDVDIPASLVIQAVNLLLEPQSVQEALRSPDVDQWKKALETEYAELMRNNTWELVERPKGKKILTSRWVFVRKQNAKGEVVRHRARLTIKGCQQEFGVNYWETYAPMVSFEAVKLVLLLALHYDLLCEHIDFVTAFLNGPIGEDVEIYMEMPKYFDDGSGQVCRLLRSLYGLKQAPLIWYQVLDKHLRSCGFQRSKMDNGVYWRVVGGSTIFLTVYVDDIIIAASVENIKLVIGELEDKFKLKDLGHVKLLLGMEINYVPGQVMWISQRGQIEKMLKRFGMENCRAVPTPQTVGELPMPATSDGEGVNDPDLPYRAIVGCLQYLVQGSRPELANAVRTLGKYLNKYTRENFVMEKRVLRYLQGKRDYGLVLHKVVSPDLHFMAYADADLGNEKDGRYSITGYVLQVNGCTYAYKSRRQRIVTDDTCCAEFVAASECSIMIIWTHNLCKELNLKRHVPTILYQDNQAAITVLTKAKGNYKTKSVDLKYHKVRDYHERDEFEVRYCPTTEMLADIITKALGPKVFFKFREQLNVMPLPIAIADGEASEGDN